MVRLVAATPGILGGALGVRVLDLGGTGSVAWAGTTVGTGVGIALGWPRSVIRTTVVVSGRAGSVVRTVVSTVIDGTSPLRRTISRGPAGGWRLLADLLRPTVVAVPVGGFAIAVIRDLPVVIISGRRAIAVTGPPAVRVGDSINHRRAVADRIVAVQVRVVVATALIVVVAVAVGIVAPAGVPGTHEHGGAERASAVAVTIAITAAVGAPDGGRGVIGVVGAG